MNTKAMIKRVSMHLVKDILAITATLFRIIVPILIIIKVLEELGFITLLAKWLSPVMTLVGLPGETALIWLSTIATGIYGGMTVFFSSGYADNLTVAEVSVLGCLMLFSHALPVEGSITKRIGLTWLVTLLLRVVGGFLFCMALHYIYQTGGYLQMANQVVIPTMLTSTTWSDWVITQLMNLLSIFMIIAVLVTVLRILRYLHIERLIGYLLTPVLKLLGISEKAVNITIIGLTLGLAYGGGLLIKEADSGQLNRQDIFAVTCLLSLSHSLLEDTVLVLMMGADIYAVLWGRLLFTLLVIVVLVRWANRRSEAFTARFLMRR